jgi:spermidine synthase
VRAWRVGVVGFGGGTVWRVLDGARPQGLELQLVGAEIDPTVVSLAREWLNQDSAGGRCRAVAGLDGRTLVESTHSGFELLVLDAYANQTEIPPHLASVEFFRACKASLAPGGWLVANVGGFGFEDPVVAAVGETLASAFEARVLALRVPFSRNFALFARRDAQPCDPESSAWKTGDADIDRRLSSVAIPGSRHWYESRGKAALTDDRNPIQELQRRSIAHAAREGLE